MEDGIDRRGYRAPRCSGCRQLPKCCLCSLLEPMEIRTKLVLVVHAIEFTRPTNTGRYAGPKLGAHIAVRGLKDVPCDLGELNPATSAVLFPTDDAELISECDTPIETLIVPDGSWAQTRRMVRRQPPLPELRAVRLPPGPASIYALRNAASRDHLCTLEAIARALRVLEAERGPAVEEALLKIVESCVAAGMVRRGMA